MQRIQSTSPWRSGESFFKKTFAIKSSSLPSISSQPRWVPFSNVSECTSLVAKSWSLDGNQVELLGNALARASYQDEAFKCNGEVRKSHTNPQTESDSATIKNEATESLQSLHSAEDIKSFFLQNRVYLAAPRPSIFDHIRPSPIYTFIIKSFIN